MSAYSTTVDISSQGQSYPTDPQVTIPFEPTSFAIINEDTDGDLYFSFDGVNDHGHLVREGTVGPTSLSWNKPYTKIWLREGATGGSGSKNVQIVAEK